MAKGGFRPKREKTTLCIDTVHRDEGNNKYKGITGQKEEEQVSRQGSKQRAEEKRSKRDYRPSCQKRSRNIFEESGKNPKNKPKTISRKILSFEVNNE